MEERLKESVVGVTPAPVFAALQRTHHWMLRGMKMLRCVLSPRTVAAADMAAGETNAQMNPGFSQLEAFLTALGVGLLLTIYLGDMWASWFQVDLHR